MNFLADESVDGPVVERLREDGHDVKYVAELKPGISDETVIELANREGRILLTVDKDFGELVFRQRRFTLGIILIRLAGLAPREKAELVNSVINQHSHELMQAFTVITPRIARLRRINKP